MLMTSAMSGQHSEDSEDTPEPCPISAMESLRSFDAAIAIAVHAGMIAMCSAGVLVGAYGVYFVWWYSGTKRVTNAVTLDDKTVIITGANAGIGRETAVDLASRGARVIMACRNPTKAREALVEVRCRSGNDNVVFRQLDTSDLQSVRDFAEQILKEEERLDILINNAGIGRHPAGPTPEGFDIVMETNHIGHFLLTMLLIDLLMHSAPSRVVTVSSIAHLSVRYIDYTDKTSKGVSAINPPYSRSKLANIHFTKELARRLEGSGVTAYSLHPGVILSSIWWTGWVSTGWMSIGRKFVYYLAFPIMWLFFLNEKDGAQTTIYCTTEESIALQSGGYFANCRLAKESKLARDEGLAKQLWAVSCEATGVDPTKLLK